MEDFYNLYEGVRRKYQILEEHGMGLGVCTNSQVLAKAGKKHIYIQGQESMEWVTTVEPVVRGLTSYNGTANCGHRSVYIFLWKREKKQKYK